MIEALKTHAKMEVRVVQDAVLLGEHCLDDFRLVRHESDVIPVHQYLQVRNSKLKRRL